VQEAGRCVIKEMLKPASARSVHTWMRSVVFHTALVLIYTFVLISAPYLYAEALFGASEVWLIVAGVYVALSVVAMIATRAYVQRRRWFAGRQWSLGHSAVFLIIMHTVGVGVLAVACAIRGVSLG
jgi:hypothetical protein